MADNLVDGEFWLPPKFLTEDDDKPCNAKMNKYSSSNNNNNFFGIRNDDIFDAVSRSLIPYLSSCSETDSEEEEHVAELTRQFALSTLELDVNSEKPKDVFARRSPQSTLSALGSSGKGSSPNGTVLEVNSQNATFDLLRAAAGEMERMRLDDNVSGNGNGFVCNNKINEPNPSPVNVNANVNAGVGLGFYSQPQQQQQQQQQQMQQPLLCQQQLHVAQSGMMRPQQQIVKQQQQRQMVPNGGRNKNNINIINNNNVRGLSGCAWPPLQNGSGMRAVFLAGKRESAGTGVFLPRSVETRNDSRKNPVCKTALVPDRVVRALNLNKGVVGGGNLQQQQQQHHLQQCFNGGNGSTVSRALGNNNNNNHYYGFSLQKRNNMKPQAQVVNQEIQLPQEWTY